MLDVPDDSPFSEKALSNVRNHFEHFDSRLTSWASEDASLTFVDGNIGPGDMIDIEGMPTYREMRHYDPATGDISCWGDTVNARTVFRATVELIPKVEAALEKL
jgi:hypothetical protein